MAAEKPHRHAKPPPTGAVDCRRSRFRKSVALSRESSRSIHPILIFINLLVRRSRNRNCQQLNPESRIVKLRGQTMVFTTSPRCDRVVLHNLTWQQFETLLQTIGESYGVRFAFDRGTLEILKTCLDIERYKTQIGTIIKDIAEVLNIEYDCLGSTTWKREAKLAGVEPDDCFYLQNESRIRGLSRFDLDRDPPPDLALEIDLTHKSLDRLAIYARLGVPEIWNYDIKRKELTIYQLDADNYSITETSSIFPQIPVREIPEILDRHRQEGRLATRRKVKDWVRNQISE